MQHQFRVKKGTIKETGFVVSTIENLEKYNEFYLQIIDGNLFLSAYGFIDSVSFRLYEDNCEICKELQNDMVAAEKYKVAIDYFGEVEYMQEKFGDTKDYLMENIRRNARVLFRLGVLYEDVTSELEKIYDGIANSRQRPVTEYEVERILNMMPHINNCKFNCKGYCNKAGDSKVACYGDGACRNYEGRDKA